MAMRILLVGANGFIGSALLRHLLAAGHEVTACVRNPQALKQRHPQLPCVTADYTSHRTTAQWQPLLRGFDVVINSVGVIRERGDNTFAQLHAQGPMALFAACATAGITAVIQISALGAGHPHGSRFLESKQQADAFLLGLPLQSYVLRPSLVYGPGGKSSLFFKAIAALPLIPLPDRGGQQVQPVAVDDLARIVAACVAGRVAPRQILDVVGAEPLTLRQMLTRYRRWLGLCAPHFVTLPLTPLLHLARGSGLFGLHGSVAEMKALLQGNAAPVAKLTLQSGIEPRGMDTTLQEHPAQQPDLWHARLYFLRPLLRLSLALLWLWTAVVSAALYPLEQSVALLAGVGIPAAWAMPLLYGAALLDLLLGLALLCNRHVRSAATVQIAVVLLYSVIITLFLAEQWLHPFGPISKNLPLLVATLTLIAMEE